MRKTYCRVCGYWGIDEDPHVSHDMCLCGGFEYGYDDWDLGISFNDSQSVDSRRYALENGYQK